MTTDQFIALFLVLFAIYGNTSKQDSLHKWAIIADRMLTFACAVIALVFFVRGMQ